MRANRLINEMLALSELSRLFPNTIWLKRLEAKVGEFGQLVRHNKDMFIDFEYEDLTEEMFNANR